MNDPDAGEALETTSQPLSASAYGFAWSDGASNPPSYWAANTGGGPITIANLATGTYRVTFGGLGGPGGNAQVVAHGTDNTRCKVQSWGQLGSDEVVNVRCHTPAGAPSNSRFVVRYGVRTSGNGSGPTAYLWADQATTASYTPMPAYNFNSTGVANTVTRSGVGAYTAKLPGLDAMNGNILITAHGISSTHCNVVTWFGGPWYPVGGTRPVEVRCWSAAGEPADSTFSLAFDGAGETGFHSVGAYAWATDQTSASYNPNPSFSYNSGFSSTSCSSAANFAGKLSTGRYFMRHTGMPDLGTTVHVTARSSTSAPDYCKVESWIGWGNDVEVKTRCFDASGVPKDVQYVESYYTTESPSPC